MGGVAPTTPGAARRRVSGAFHHHHPCKLQSSPMNEQEKNEEENRTHKNSLFQYGGKHEHSVCLSKPTPCCVNFTQKYLTNLYHSPNNQTTHGVRHDLHGSNSCMSQPPPGRMGFLLHQKLGNNYTGPLGAQLCKSTYVCTSAIN